MQATLESLDPTCSTGKNLAEPVRGSLETHINVATLDGSYSIIVDNRSGKTRVIDENDIAARSDPHGDHVDAPLAELPPMPPPAQG